MEFMLYISLKPFLKIYFVKIFIDDRNLKLINFQYFLYFFIFFITSEITKIRQSIR